LSSTGVRYDVLLTKETHEQMLVIRMPAICIIPGINIRLHFIRKDELLNSH